MKDMRTIFMDQESVLVVMIKSVAPDMIAFIYDQYFFSCALCQALGHYGARKACSHYQIIKHIISFVVFGEMRFPLFLFRSGFPCLKLFFPTNARTGNYRPYSA